MNKVVMAGALMSVASLSHAWLGGFEGTDGYRPFLNMVQNYNAGQHGAGSGYGGSYSPITPNTGLWKAISGGFSSMGSISYATGHQWYDRTDVNNGLFATANQGLVFTTGHEGWSGPSLKYSYDLDSNDLGGLNPLSTGAGNVNLTFWWCAQLAGPEVGGALADGYFGDEIQFLDSSGNVGFQLGLTQRASGDKVTFWDGTGMQETGIVAASGRYDRWNISLNMINDTFSASYFSFATSTTTILASNAPMLTNMNNFTQMTFRTSPGVTNAKLMSVDDFRFQPEVVPEPGTVAVLGAGALALLRKRRRQLKA